VLQQEVKLQLCSKCSRFFSSDLGLMYCFVPQVGSLSWGLCGYWCWLTFKTLRSYFTEWNGPPCCSLLLFLCLWRYGNAHKLHTDMLNPLGSNVILGSLRCFDMPWHLCFFSFAYKHINGTGEITLFSTNRATIICEQHVCTFLYF